MKRSIKEPRRRFCLPADGKRSGGIPKATGALMVILSAVAGVAHGGCHYAAFGDQHTMCQYTPSACPSGVLMEASKPSCEEKDLILDLHNKLRQKVATGGVPRQPPATNMLRMVWDNELEELSKRWAEQCRIGHDSVRDVGRFGVGQNVAATWSFSKEPKVIGRAPEWERLINGWFDEVVTVGFDPNHIKPFKFNMPVGHYTQMVWAETYAVGCAYVYFHAKDTGYTKLYVCNYGPRGNIIGGEMYGLSSGGGRDICQKASHVQSAAYPGLCETEGMRYPNHCEQENKIPQREIVILPPPQLGQSGTNDQYVGYRGQQAVGAQRQPAGNPAAAAAAVANQNQPQLPSTLTMNPQRYQGNRAVALRPQNPLAMNQGQSGQMYVFAGRPSRVTVATTTTTWTGQSSGWPAGGPRQLSVMRQQPSYRSPWSSSYESYQQKRVMVPDMNPLMNAWLALSRRLANNFRGTA